jgi:EAL domain-containing protein (putative c-di-GMP-specific phosphodiesterase class I)
MLGGPDSTAGELLVDADLAMYDAKEDGRNRVAVYRPDEETQPRIKARLTWLERIQEGLDNDRFVLFAQPIIDVHSGAIDQHELLVRLKAAGGELVPPGTFLDVAERFDLVQRIDRVVMRKAVELIAEHQAEGRRIPLSVNLSGRTLGDPTFLLALESELTQHAIDPGLLSFELTETAAVANIHLARRFAERLHDLGCQFALDDFGAGFGSFYYLKHLPFDYLKIDGEFVRQCTSSLADQLVIRAVVDIAQGLGKRTVAEFTEDEATLTFLRRHGVDLAQGYHVGRPVPVAEALGVDGLGRPATELR